MPDAFEDDCTGVFTCHGQHFFADDLRSQVCLVEILVERLLDEIRLPLLDDEHRALVGAETSDLSPDQGIGDIKHIQRDAAGAKDVGKSKKLQRPDDEVVQPTLQNNADILPIAAEDLIQSVLLDETDRGRPASVDFVLLLHKRERWQDDLICGAVGSLQCFPNGERRSFVVLGDEVSVDVTGTDAQFEHHRCVALL